MRSEQLRQAWAKSPFQAFTIYLSDQRHFEISHEDELWIMPNGRTIGIANENGTAEIVDLMHVVSLKFNGEEQ